MLKLSDEVRTSSSSSILEIIETVELSLAGNDEENMQSSLRALDSLARTMAPGEESAFAELIPTLLPLIHNKSCNESAMDALSAIWYVPYVRCGYDGTNWSKVQNLVHVLFQTSRWSSESVQS